jgi:hypothetical protein
MFCMYKQGAPTFSAQAEAAPPNTASISMQAGQKTNPAVGEVSLNLPGTVGRAVRHFLGY